MTRTTEQRALRAAAALFAGFGLITALGAWPPTAAPATALADVLAWPYDGAGPALTPEGRLMFAINGGITVGWAVLIWQVAGAVMDRMPEVGRRMLVLSILAWFPVDSAASVLAGAAFNVLPNILLAAMILLPIWIGGRTGARQAA
jgi:hypothetical protein